MMYSKIEMYNMLVDCVGLPQEGVDLVLQIMGDTPDTYKKILTKTTDYRTFQEVDEESQVD